MNPLETLAAHFDEHAQVVKASYNLNSKAILDATKQISDSLSKGGTLFLCGNGGSAADSQHLSAELVGRFEKERKALRAIALTTDSSILTCVGNDYGYEHIFSRQLEALAKAGDVLLAISTSGSSDNVVNAIKQANTLGLNTIALVGSTGGEAKKLAHLAILIPSAKTARIQEVHILIGHILCDLIEQEMCLA